NQQAFAVDDLNGDGKADIVVANAGGGVDVLMSEGAGTFAAPVSYPGIAAAPYARWIAIADLDGGGKPDVLIATSTSLAVMTNAGDGTFAPPNYYPGATTPRAITAADMDGDGRLDLVALNATDQGSVAVLLNRAGGLPAASYAPGRVGNVVACADLDGDE